MSLLITEDFEDEVDRDFTTGVLQLESIFTAVNVLHLVNGECGNIFIYCWKKLKNTNAWYKVVQIAAMDRTVKVNNQCFFVNLPTLLDWVISFPL